MQCVITFSVLYILKLQCESDTATICHWHLTMVKLVLGWIFEGHSDTFIWIKKKQKKHDVFEYHPCQTNPVLYYFQWLNKTRLFFNWPWCNFYYILIFNRECSRFFNHFHDIVTSHLYIKTTLKSISCFLRLFFFKLNQSRNYDSAAVDRGDL